MSQAEYQRGFVDAAEYILSKVQKSRAIEVAVNIIREVIGTLKAQHIRNLDEALMILE